jgi:hypothetical protein
MDQQFSYLKEICWPFGPKSLMFQTISQGIALGWENRCFLGAKGNTIRKNAPIEKQRVFCNPTSSTR